MFNHTVARHFGLLQRSAQAVSPLRTTLALGCVALALAGCGGGSGSAEPVNPPTPSSLGTPENFKVGWNLRFSWNATQGATRYELFADPDGVGPQTEVQMGEPQGLNYSNANEQFSGYLARAQLPDLINATFRLRACNADGCGAFTAAQTSDTKSISYEFPSGHAPLKATWGSFDPLSKDGLTLVASGSVFARSASGKPWLQQGKFPSNARRTVLSADGDTVATSESETVQIYQRRSGSWSLQATIQSTNTPPACQQPCKVIADNMALSADGNLLAVTGRSGSASYGTTVVFTYIRTGTTWAPQGHLAPSASPVDNVVGSTMALSGDGRTLVVNGGAITRSSTFTPPYLHFYTQTPEGVWSEQARLPAGIVNFLDIAGSRYSVMALSNDGNTLAVEAQHLPGRQTAEFDIGAADLTCGSKEPWSTTPLPAGFYSTVPGWHIALFARDGATWRRQAIMARDTQPWALANDGNTLFYGDELFNRRNGAWACP